MVFKHDGQTIEVDQKQFGRFIKIRTVIEDACFFFELPVPEIIISTSEKVSLDRIQICIQKDADFEETLTARRIFSSYICKLESDETYRQHVQNIITDSLIELETGIIADEEENGIDNSNN